MLNGRNLGLLLVVCLGLACGAPDGLLGPNAESLLGEPPVQTDRSEYMLRGTETGLETEIPYTYTNRTGETVYVVNCKEIVRPVLQKRVDEEWVFAWSTVVPACLSPPIVIEPGETYADTLPLFAGHPSNNWRPKFEVDEVAGTYRLLMHDMVHEYDENRRGFGDSLALEQRVSNRFRLELEQE